MGELPATTETCGGCDKPLELLTDHLMMTLKPVRGVLVSTEAPAEGDEIPTVNYAVGTKSGRGVLLHFHDFACQSKWVEARKELKPKLEYHHEEGEPYEPADNRTPEELVEAGELPKEILAFQAALEPMEEKTSRARGDRS